MQRNIRKTNNFDEKVSKHDRQFNGDGPNLHSCPSPGKVSAEMPKPTPEEIKQNYGSWVSLDLLAKEELKWWLENMTIRNGKPIKIQSPDLVISSDAARGQQGGWGAHCGSVSVGGQWTQLERQHHINILELKAALLAVKMFTKNRNKISIHLLLDNQVALAHVIKMGCLTNQTLLVLTREIWLYLMLKEITLPAKYIPSALNKEADF